LLWGLTTVVFKVAAGEALAASDPVTVREALLNAVYNAVFFGLLLGSVIGAAGGAVMGPFVTRGEAKNLQLGVWLGIVFVAPLGLAFVQASWVAELLSMLEGGMAGAIGGSLADKVFVRLYSRYE
jgi:hypothetical protein